MDLKCRKTKCKYNNGFTCKAKSITVSEKTECDTYECDSEKDTRDTSRCMFEEAPAYSPHREKKSLKVGCSATKCLFNENGICIANGLTINAIAENPLCMTYIKQ
ncbi:MAG: DUF1540 domain-containing protein [Clostridia bacterium]|nr:DUF1540 domain-containing protein [Clostridia bacterium]